MVEFLAVFPAFLILSMFVLEIGFTWADRHVARLAAFEAARIYAAANMPAWENGLPIYDPCKAHDVDSRARQAAVRRIAAIAPPIGMFIARLGVDASGLDLSDIGNGSIVGAMRRFAERWPVAAVSTEVKCNWDAARGTVAVDVTYHRMLQTPIVDRIMWLAFRLTQINTATGGVVQLGLDQNFMGVQASIDTPLAMVQAQSAMNNALNSVQQNALPLNQAAAMLNSIPGVDKLLGTVPKVPVNLLPKLQQAGLAATESMLNQANQVLNNQTTLLTAIVGAVPPAFWRIPIETHVTLQRETFTRAAHHDLGPKEPAWDGKLAGAINLTAKPETVLGFESSTSLYRKWAHELSTTENKWDIHSTAKDLP